MEIFNCLLLLWAGVIIIFQVFFIKYLQEKNEKLEKQNEIVLEFYERLFKEIFKTTDELKKIKNENRYKNEK